MQQSVHLMSLAFHSVDFSKVAGILPARVEDHGASGQHACVQRGVRGDCMVGDVRPWVNTYELT